MSKLKMNLTNRQFGNLKVLSINEEKTLQTKKSHYNCKCICGNVIVVSYYVLKYSKKSECNCMNNKDKNIHKLWKSIKSRCYNKNDINFKYYGGKQIILCESWETFDNFQDWCINNGYKKDLILHRKNSNLDYEPLNCEFLTKEEYLTRCKNNENLISININNVILTKTLSEWSRYSGIARETLKYRYLKGVRNEQFLEKPIKRKGFNLLNILTLS